MTRPDSEILFFIPLARANCRQAWNSLIKRFQLPLLAYCCERLGNREDALDAVQQTFVKAIKHLPSLRDDTKFTSWIYGIARQACIDSIRRRGREAKAYQTFSHQEPFPTVCPGENAANAEEVQLVITLVRELESDLQEPLILYYLEDFSLSEIAEIMHVPNGTIKSRLHRARQILKTKMEEANVPTR